MPEVITDAKLGHLQKMLESIPYLDCCERQQRHLEDLGRLGPFCAVKSSGLIHLLLVITKKRT